MCDYQGVGNDQDDRYYLSTDGSRGVQWLVQVLAEELRWMCCVTAETGCVCRLHESLL